MKRQKYKICISLLEEAGGVVAKWLESDTSVHAGSSHWFDILVIYIIHICMHMILTGPGRPIRLEGFKLSLGLV